MFLSLKSYEKKKDCKKFKMVRKNDGKTDYYITLKNNGGRCPVCGKWYAGVT